MLDEPKCYKRECKWYVGIIQPDGTEETEVNFCGAFPEGIPDDIAYGNNKHLKVQKDQAKDYVYTKGKLFEELPKDDLDLWQSINEGKQ